MGTISAREPMAGYPFTNPWDISDGTSPEVSTGIPYMYFTDMEMSVIDLKVSKPKICNQVPSLSLSRWRTLTQLKI